MKTTQYVRACPKCNGNIYHKSEQRLNRALLQQAACPKCAQKGISKGKGRKQTSEHIRKRAEAVSKYRSGKTYAEIYGEERGQQIAKNHSKALTGRKRPKFTDEWKANMSINRKNSEVYKAQMNSDDYKNKRREINARRFYGISLKDWYDMTSRKRLYYLTVLAITRQQKISTLEHYEKRGTFKKDGYHLDHIYPISLGFINNIPPETIGNISNLRFIPWRENLLKSNKVLPDQKSPLK